MTIVIAGAFFVAFIAVGYFGIKQREAEEAARERELQHGRSSDAARARGLTSDEVVLQLERRIDEEIREISYDLRAPERYSRAFQA